LSTEGVIDSGSSVEFHGGGWLEVESTNSINRVWLVINIRDQLDFGGVSGSLLLELVRNGSIVLGGLFSRGLLKTSSFVTLASKAYNVKFSNLIGFGIPVSGSTRNITLNTGDISSG
jgi:hypothetical protein